jgi:amino acid permease
MPRQAANEEPLLAKAAGVTVSEATISLAKTCIGTGVMALPYAFQMGGVCSIPSLLLLGLWNWATSHRLLLARAAVTPDVGESPARTAYSKVMAAAMGGRIGSKLLEGSLSILLIGVCSSMQVQASQLISACLGIDYWAAVIGTMVILVPLVMMRTIKILASVAGAGLGVLGVGLAAVGAYGVSVVGVPPLSPNLYQLPSLRELAIFYGIASFSFGLQVTLLPVQDGMKQPSRASEAVAWSLVIVVAFYALIGVCLSSLFWRAEGGVQQLVLLNLPAPSAVATLVQLSSALVAVLSYPLLLMPVVQMVPTMFIRDDTTKPDEPGLAVRHGLLALTTVIAIALREFGIASGLCGCLAIILTQVLPPLCHLRLCTWPPAPPQTEPWQPLSVRRQQWATRHPAGRRPFSAALDVALIGLGLCTFVYFTTQFVCQMLDSEQQQPEA